MKKQWVSLAVALLVCSCVDSNNVKPVPNIQLNVNPKKSYGLDVRFVENPGPFKEIDVTAHYRVGDYCTPPEPLSGAVLPPEHSIKLAVKKVDDGHYSAVFHQDALRDEDYFGLGLCRWALQNVAVKFKSPSTQFLASLSSRGGEIQADLPQTQYYLSSDYFKKPQVGDIVFGEKAGFYLPSLGTQFRVILATKNM